MLRPWSSAGRSDNYPILRGLCYIHGVGFPHCVKSRSCIRGRLQGSFLLKPVTWKSFQPANGANISFGVIRWLVIDDICQQQLFLVVFSNLPYHCVHMRICCVCGRGPNSWVPRGPRLRTERNDQRSQETAQKGDPENRTTRPTSPPTGRSWRCCSATMSGSMRRICGWRMSGMPWLRTCSSLSHLHKHLENTLPLSICPSLRTQDAFFRFDFFLRINTDKIQ